MFGGAVCPVIGSATSPKCTAAVCASDSTKPMKVTAPCCSSGPRSCVSSSLMPPPKLEWYHGRMPQDAGAKFERLIQIMRTLRAPGGCPWDREQTHASLRPFVLEETYEVLEAIEEGTPAQLREELGDFLFEAVFLAQISEEAGDFGIGDAIDEICTKLVRRHPHVFEKEAGDQTMTSAQVLEKW